MTTARASVTAAELWRPLEGDVLEGTVVSEFGRWLATGTDGTMRTTVLETDDGSRWHVARATWATLHEALRRVRPLRGDRLRLERLADDAEGRRCFCVERPVDAQAGAADAIGAAHEASEAASNATNSPLLPASADREATAVIP